MNGLVNFLKTVIGFFQNAARFNRALPAIFDDVDNRLPALLGRATAGQVEALISDATRKATGKRATKRQIKKIEKLYSPVKAARKKSRG
jgi:hypothetical protein